MANKIHKGKIDREINRTVSTDAAAANELIAKGQVEGMITQFTAITENQFGTHPAFTTQHALNSWLLGNSTSGGATTLNSPTGLTASNTKADENTINWTDTNS